MSSLLGGVGVPYKIRSVMQAVALALQCLSFDFVGTCLDESSEDLGTIQVWMSPLIHVHPAAVALQSAQLNICCRDAQRRFVLLRPLCLALPQVPSTWRPVTEDPTTLQLFLDYYAASTPPLSKHALECLVRHLPHHGVCN